MSFGYQYVVLRCVPDIVREEFLNVGVVLYSQMSDFLDVGFELDPQRLQSFSPSLDSVGVRLYMEEAAQVCRGGAAPGRPELRRLGQRFGWLSAPRSTVLQPGPVHGGITDDPAAELERLVGVLVSSPDETPVADPVVVAPSGDARSGRSTPDIRVARAADAPTLRNLAHGSWSHVHNPMPGPQPLDEPFFNERHQPDDVLVAEIDGEMVGYILFGRPYTMETGSHVHQVQGLDVSERARGRGVGRALVHACLRELQQRGARRVTLRVLGHNTGARRLYESEGFVVEGVLPGEFLLDGKYVDDVLMGMRMPPPA